jgi:photosynthetic reaction center cytochrome c subunit
MKIDLRLPIALGVVAVLLGLLALTFEAPRMTLVQWGFRGNGTEQVYSAATIARTEAANVLPVAQDKVEKSGKKASEVYENVKVLGDLDENEFTRLMLAITEWVSPEQGCNYCHNEEGFAHDKMYQKRVARSMLQMTLDINANWKNHVQNTGVTCYTCHRGQNVPAYIWFNNEPGGSMAGIVPPKPIGQNTPVSTVAYSSLPYDYGTAFLEGDGNIRVNSEQALPDKAKNNTSTMRTEWTYGLMMHMSSSLGVNCTYCHNTRNFAGWEKAPPQRVSAWHGIRMVRTLNTGYLNPLRGEYPANRLGALGDAPKLNCATCHQGAFKPLLGRSMIPDHPELAPASYPMVPYNPKNVMIMGAATGTQ